jgi:DNA topoisomerase-1
VAEAKGDKFARVRALLSEWEDIRSQIEGDLNDPSCKGLRREAAMLAMLTYETGIRPGSNADTRARIQAYGSTTLQLRHVQPCSRGVRLRFIGKKGVSQNILVTNPYLSRVFMARKRATPHYTAPLFIISGSSLRSYFRELGSGDYSPKDFRTGCGTRLALDLVGNRTRFPKSKAKRKALLNRVLDRVAAKLGNTRAMGSSYVDPEVFEAILAGRRIMYGE